MQPNKTVDIFVLPWDLWGGIHLPSLKANELHGTSVKTCFIIKYKLQNTIELLSGTLLSIPKVSIANQRQLSLCLLLGIKIISIGILLKVYKEFLQILPHLICTVLVDATVISLSTCYEDRRWDSRVAKGYYYPCPSVFMLLWGRQLSTWVIALSTGITTTGGIKIVQRRYHHLNFTSKEAKRKFSDFMSEPGFKAKSWLLTCLLRHYTTLIMSLIPWKENSVWF